MRLSIRNTLLLLLFLVLLLAIGMNSIFGHLVARSEVNEVFDAELAVSAKLIKGLLNQTNITAELPAIAAALNETIASTQTDQPELTAYERTRLIQIWRRDGSELLFRSPGAPEYALAPMRKGFYHHEGKGGEWMVYVTDLPATNSWLMVGEYPQGRTEIIDELGQVFGVSGVIALILCTLMALTAIEYGLGPLRELGGMLRRRSLRNLQAVQLERMPKELEPVVGGLNQMFVRLSQGLERERRFVADAAHELRTPLAVLKLQTQHLQQMAGQTLSDELQQLEHSADRATRVVEQLLLLARLDENETAPDCSLQDLAELCRLTLAAMQWRADEAGCVLSFDAPAHLPAVCVNSTMLEIALVNLLENAFRYGPGQPVAVAVSLRGERLQLTVRDHGPGVAEAELGRLTERFYRAGVTSHGGAGLGLSIVGRVMEVQGGYVQVRNHTDGGLDVALCWPVDAPGRPAQPD
ncbi:ATP-binding protein [Thalassolituus sp. LLYu03]|uniref:ATP-binding protein n=1 Tax=Thalassolituus sp. LLYu03 TaxID=3421656 RepID=UPI003D29B7F2